MAYVALLDIFKPFLLYELGNGIRKVTFLTTTLRIAQDMGLICFDPYGFCRVHCDRGINMRNGANYGLMLAHCLQRWPTIKP